MVGKRACSEYTEFRQWSYGWSYLISWEPVLRVMATSRLKVQFRYKILPFFLLEVTNTIICCSDVLYLDRECCFCLSLIYVVFDL